ncbi:ArsR/SmtB family transcription factor [Staphylospora marina]|uniref:ArsR/SmtB family transcription factor n=1 Tax=Staphylospora marina TaxID=2490858 RepID=UPI000F5C04A5|nr:metalloregulator ArsR/SmtB family transcription factor [Staphylospora marina]
MENERCCEVLAVDEERTNRIRADMEHEDFEGTAAMFKALSDPTRLKIAYALSREGELCVCDVACIIGSSTATASHHLRSLARLRVAKRRRDGKMVYYSLDEEPIRRWVEVAFEHRKEGREHERE